MFHCPEVVHGIRQYTVVSLRSTHCTLALQCCERCTVVYRNAQVDSRELHPSVALNAAREHNGRAPPPRK